MVDGVNPIGSEGVLPACVDEVECTEDDFIDGRMDKVCNSSSGVILARPSASDIVPPRRPPVFYLDLPPHLILDLACL